MPGSLTRPRLGGAALGRDRGGGVGGHLVEERGPRLPAARRQRRTVVLRLPLRGGSGRAPGAHGGRRRGARGVGGSAARRRWPRRGAPRPRKPMPRIRLVPGVFMSPTLPAAVPAPAARCNRVRRPGGSSRWTTKGCTPGQPARSVARRRPAAGLRHRARPGPQVARRREASRRRYGAPAGGPESLPAARESLPAARRACRGKGKPARRREAAWPALEAPGRRRRLLPSAGSFAPTKLRAWPAPEAPGRRRRLLAGAGSFAPTKK